MMEYYDIPNRHKRDYRFSRLLIKQHRVSRMGDGIIRTVALLLKGKYRRWKNLLARIKTEKEMSLTYIEHCITYPRCPIGFTYSKKACYFCTRVYISEEAFLEISHQKAFQDRLNSLLD